MEQDLQENSHALKTKGDTAAGWTYKTLLVPVDARKRSERSIELACRLAARFDAHVIGLHLEPTFFVPPEVYAYGNTAPIAAIEEGCRRIAEQARAVFDAAARRGPHCSLEWRTDRGNAPLLMQQHARYVDLIVINQTDAEAADASHFADDILLSVGRPILLLPYTGNLDKVGSNVLVCWNASHEAARAVIDAVPFLQRASKVTVMSIDAGAPERGHGDQSGGEIAVFLARHGVKVEVAQTVSGGLGAGEVILSRAADYGADLIVMGAYGRARMREVIFGGATRTILRSMTVPVLMSH